MSRQNKSKTRSLATVLIFGCVMLMAGLLSWYGWTFYILDTNARIDHPQYRSLSPSGLVGHGYGIVGTALVVTNLLYLIRRKLARFSLGPMRVWLDMHVFTGLVGSVLVLFHSAFRVRTPLAAVTSISLAIVVLTGIMGRYIYGFAQATSRARLAELLTELEGFVPGVGRAVHDALAAAPAADAAGPSTFFGALAYLPQWMRVGRERRQAVLRAIEEASRRAPPLDSHAQRWVTTLKRRIAKAAKSEAGEAASRALMRTWRSAHRLLAIMMLFSVTVHIAVAWYYGYRFIWSE